MHEVVIGDLCRRTHLWCLSVVAQWFHYTLNSRSQRSSLIHYDILWLYSWGKGIYPVNTNYIRGPHPKGPPPFSLWYYARLPFYTYQKLFVLPASNSLSWKVWEFEARWLTRLVSYPDTHILGCPPSQDSSGKWRFSWGFPTKNWIFLVVTVTGKGDNTTHIQKFYLKKS